MHLIGGPTSLRLLLALWLLHQLGPAAADSGHGTLRVSVTVLPSCEVRVNGNALSGAAGAADRQSADAATVICPDAYPYRASLDYGAATGIVKSGGSAGFDFTGVRRVELSRLAAGANSGATNDFTLLTISY
jgi:hypothetical protein